MEYKNHMNTDIKADTPLELILCGSIQHINTDKTGVVSVVYVTADKSSAAKKLKELTAQNPDNYYMLYSVPLNTDLTTLSHYPSIAVTKTDLV